MEKAHYCERFLELMVDLEVTYHVCNSENNLFLGEILFLLKSFYPSCFATGSLQSAFFS